jgi:Na+-transporting NADH:ubiquinone oxidoreductase subunit NqrF
MRLDPTMPRIYIENCSESFDCAATQNVLTGMMCLVPTAIPVRFRGGGCGVCKVRVLRGHYRTVKMSRASVSEEEQQQGYALACRLYADEGDLYLQVVGRMQRALQQHVDARPGTWGN